MNKETFAYHAIRFNSRLAGLTDDLLPTLPMGYRYMNPFATGEALAISSDFYRKYYKDTGPRRIIFGINPGRHGAGLTGVPFTDSKRLLDVLHLDSRGITSHEPSAVFIYEVVRAWGGVSSFFNHFYINSPLPLGLLRLNQRGNWVNANYYDYRHLLDAVQPLMAQSMQDYLAMPILRDVAWCLGQSQNFEYLQRINAVGQYFKRIIPLPHPRYVVQYKSKNMATYVADMVTKISCS